MPWHIEQRDGRHCVIQDDDGTNEGCHDTRAEAEEHMAALYASEHGQGKSMSKPTTQVQIKAIDDDTITVAGYGVVFGGEDLEGETFTPETDFMLDLVPTKLALYDHRQNEVVKHPIGNVRNEDIRRDEVGLWIEAQLDRSRAYVDAIRDLIEEGVLGWSSGSVGHLVERAGKSITQWPLVEFSLTPTPAEPRTLGVRELRSLINHVDQLKQLLPDEQLTASDSEAPSSQAAGDAATGGASIGAGNTYSVTINQVGQDRSFEGDRTMGDEAKNQEQERKAPDQIKRADRGDEIARTVTDALNTWKAEQIDPLNERTETQAKSIDSMSDKIDRLLEHMQNEPAFRKAGYYTEDGGDADQHVKSFGDFLLAVKRRDVKRLATVYKALPTKDLSEDSGSAGGYLVPQEHETELLQMAAMNNEISNRVRRVPVNSNSGTWPALDQYVAPTAGAGNTAFAGGVTADMSASGATLNETEPSFEMLEWRLHKVGGFTEVENELIDDSPESIEALLSMLFAVAVGAKQERNILRGSGAGEPLGILNAQCAIGITPATNSLFSWTDVGAMWSRFKGAGGQAVWTIHPGVWPDILNMEVGTAGGNVWTANMQGPAGNNINGFPIITSEHLPQDDNSGNVLLADYSAYLLFVKRGLMVSFSEHAAFTSDKGTWKFTQRADGMPWLKNVITLADPQGSYTVSPFIYHND